MSLKACLRASPLRLPRFLLNRKPCFQQKNAGHTLIELIIVTTLTGIIIAGVYLLWAALAKSWMTERVKSNLHAEMQVALSNLKKEMRLSSGNEVFYYPSAPYTALSFPIAVDTDNDGLLDLDSNNNIIWNRTVIYHAFENAAGKSELRRTIFTPRDNTLSVQEREEQLASVSTQGDGSATYNSANATTKILLNDLETFEIIPAFASFDGYHSILIRSEYVNFGSLLLSPGNHTLRFEVEDKSNLSSDFHFAIDAIYLSPSGGYREAEELLPAVGSSGKGASNVDLSAIGSWSGNAHLFYAADSIGDYLELEIYNDEWIETNFEHQDAQQDGTLVQFESTLSPPEIVLKLEGMKETWEAENPTGAISAPYVSNPPDLPSLRGTTFRILITQDAVQTKGEQCRFLFRAHPSQGNLKINSAFIEPRTSGQNGNNSLKERIYFNNLPVLIGTTQDLASGAIGATGNTSMTIPAGYEVYSNWIDFSVLKDKDYLVSYAVADESNQEASYYAGPFGSVNAYWRTGDHADESVWNNSGTDFAHIVALAAIQVTYPEAGIWTSQIYDTKMSSPNFSQLSWEKDLPLGTDIHLFFRSSNSATMEDNPSWIEFANSPGVIPSTSTGRYIQMKAELYATAPYFLTPQLKRCSVRWPGEETVVEIGGYFSKNSDYGQIRLTVDGQDLSKSIEARISTVTTYQGKEQRSTISAEIEPRNTPQ